MKIKISLFFLVISIAVCFIIFNFNILKTGETERSEPVVIELLSKDVVNFFDGKTWVDYQDKEIKLKLADILKKKEVYIHLWASWCAPCLNEIPELIAYAKNNKDRVQFIVVSLDESSETLAKFLKSFPELNDSLFIQVWDKSLVASKKLNADRLPMTIFLPTDTTKIRTLRSVVDWKSL